LRAVTPLHVLSLHDALPILGGDEDALAVEARIVDAIFDVGEDRLAQRLVRWRLEVQQARQHPAVAAGIEHEAGVQLVFAAVGAADRKSTRLNSSHVKISYAV